MYKDENHQVTREIELFNIGVKPMISLYFPMEENRDSVIQKYMLDRFSNIAHSHKHYDFFQNINILHTYEEKYAPIVEELEKAYKKGKNGEKKTKQLEDKRLTMLGQLLGFPPLAVKAYVQDFFDGTYRKHHKRECDIVVDYYGIHFGTKKEYLDKDLLWLERKYSVPEHLKKELWISNEYKDYVEIYQVSKDRVKELGLDKYENVIIKP